MKKILLTLFFCLFSLNAFAQDFGDFSPNKATRIKVINFDSYFDSASPSTVQSALFQIAASYPVVSPVTLSNSLIPVIDGTYDIGEPARKWQDLYANTINASDVTVVNASSTVVDTQYIENSRDGAVTFRDTVDIGIPDTQVLWSDSGVIAGDADFTFNDGTNALTLAADTDVITTLGRWRMGYIGAGFPDLAYLSHYDYFDWNTYALMQDNSGNTYLNGSDMVYFLTDGITAMRLYDSAGTDIFHLTDTTLALGGGLGSERVEITQSGTNPTLLDINTDYSNLRLDVHGDIWVPDGETIGTTSYGWLFDETNGDISTTANVGIGTTGPGSELEVSSTGATRIDVSTSGTTSAADATLRLSHDNDAVGIITFRETDGTAKGFITDIQGADVTGLRLGYGSNSEVVRIQSDGNVGIGVIDPSEALDVNGRIELTQQSGSTNDGALWNDSTQEALQTYVSGIEQTLVGTIFTQTADQTIADTTTETTLFGSGVGTLTLPANFWVVGKTLRIEIHGDFSDTGNPTAQIKVKLDAVELSDSTAITLSGLGGTEEWETEVIITCRSVGGSGTVMTVVDWEYETTTGSSAIERLDIAGTLQTVNTTQADTLDVTFQWGTANALNTIHSHVGFVEVLN